MQQKTVDKMLLCLQEMSYCKEILDEKCSDNQIAHLLGIYCAIRMSDFIHLLPNYQAGSNKKDYVDEHVQNYKNELEKVRNKMGAHFQTIVKEGENGSDLIERNSVFQSIDYRVVLDSIEDAKIIFQIVTDTTDHEPTIKTIEENDKKTIIDICKKNNKDNGARIYNDILGLSRPNGVTIFTCSKGAEKVQQLLTVKMFISDIRQLHAPTYNCIELKRVFKRMLICWIINFYDNMVTRPLAPNAPQNDDGLDKLLADYFDDDRTRDVQTRISGLFDKMNNLSGAVATIDAARVVRNKCCGHFDGAMDTASLNATLDGYDENALVDLYDKWLKTFCMILESHHSLSPLNLSIDTVIYDAEVESKGEKSFYGSESVIDYSMYLTSNLTIEEAVKALEGSVEGALFDLALQKIHTVLFEAKGKDYKYLCNTLRDKFTNGLSENELCNYCRLLYKAKQGYPEKKMKLILSLWDIVKHYQTTVHKYILWPLSVNACFDQNGKLKSALDEMAQMPMSFHHIYSGLIAFRATIKKEHSGLEYMKNPDFCDEIEKYIVGIKETAERLALCLSIASYWFFDYAAIYKNWSKYESKVMELLGDAYDLYAQEVGLDEEDNKKFLVLIKSHRFIELTWYLMMIEKDLERGNTAFAELCSQGLLYGGSDVIERTYWALCKDEVGETAFAYQVLKNVVNEDIYDKCRQINLYRLLAKHDEYKDEAKELKAEIEKNFTLDEQDRKWMDGTL